MREKNIKKKSVQAIQTHKFILIWTNVICRREIVVSNRTGIEKNEISRQIQLNTISERWKIYNFGLRFSSLYFAIDKFRNENVISKGNSSSYFRDLVHDIKVRL